MCKDGHFMGQSRKRRKDARKRRENKTRMKIMVLGRSSLRHEDTPEGLQVAKNKGDGEHRPREVRVCKTI
jgi:hypothetical protein